MYTVIVKQLLEMRMFRFFEYVGLATVAFFISMAVGSFNSHYKDFSIIEQAIAAEDALGIPIDPPPAKAHPDDIECMSRNIYHEAGNQSKAGMIAVARVVMNRVQDRRFPNNVCDVIYEGPLRESWKTKQDPLLAPEERIFYPRRDRCQFSWYCDGKSDEIVSKTNNIAWRQAQDIAYLVLNFNKYNGIVDGATHYHADYVQPYWTTDMKYLGKVGLHKFYKK